MEKGCVRLISVLLKTTLKPALEKLKTSWEVDLVTDSATIDRAIYKTLDEVVLPKITEKKFAKSFIMPHAYGLTEEGSKRYNY